MSVWTLHLLNARKRLIPVMSQIRATAREAVARVGDHAELPPFDLVVRAGDGPVPDGGIIARSPGPGVIEVTLAPDRADTAPLLRVLVREMAHLIRWDGPGYGRSLGEVLVSEGVAGHFVLHILGGPPDACDSVRPPSGVARQAMNEWARRDYDHARWFEGKGDLRKWTGHGLGHRLIAEHLGQNPDVSATSLATAPADPFRQTLRRITATDGQDMPEAPSED